MKRNPYAGKRVVLSGQRTGAPGHDVSADRASSCTMASNAPVDTKVRMRPDFIETQPTEVQKKKLKK